MDDKGLSRCESHGCVDDSFPASRGVGLLTFVQHSHLPHFIFSLFILTSSAVHYVEASYS